MMPTVFRSLAEVRGHFGPCAVAIGNFDGVHIGHQALLAEMTAFAGAHNLIPAVLTFHPHPTAIVAPQRLPKLICTLDEKLRLLGSFGVRHVFVLPFDASVAALSPQDFVRNILVEGLQSRGVFVGENFRFGCKKEGDTGLLESLGEIHGFAARCLPPVMFRGEVVSSSAVRRYIEAGHVSRANRLLGRCFALHGPVVSGHGVGSKQTVPTLNLRSDPALVLPRGVFVSQTHDWETSREWPSITNVGMRPTFGGDELTIETFLLAPLGDRAPEQITVSFRLFIRSESQFPTPADLKAQIMRDVSRAQAYWRRASGLLRTAASIY